MNVLVTVGSALILLSVALSLFIILLGYLYYYADPTTYCACCGKKIKRRKKGLKSNGISIYYCEKCQNLKKNNDNSNDDKEVKTKRVENVDEWLEQKIKICQDFSDDPPADVWND